MPLWTEDAASPWKFLEGGQNSFAGRQYEDTTPVISEVITENFRKQILDSIPKTKHRPILIDIRKVITPIVTPFRLSISKHQMAIICQWSWWPPTVLHRKREITVNSLNVRRNLLAGIFQEDAVQDTFLACQSRPAKYIHYDKTLLGGRWFVVHLVKKYRRKRKQQTGLPPRQCSRSHLPCSIYKWMINRSQVRQKVSYMQITYTWRQAQSKEFHLAPVQADFLLEPHMQTAYPIITEYCMSGCGVHQSLPRWKNQILISLRHFLYTRPMYIKNIHWPNDWIWGCAWWGTPQFRRLDL